MTMKHILFLALLAAALFPLQAQDAKPSAPVAGTKILPGDWNPKQAADKVMPGLVNVCAPQVKGAHDSDLVVLNDRAYVVYMANDERSGENAEWPFIYDALSIVNLKTLAVEKIIPFAASRRAYENETLPTGACFVPRLLRKDSHTLRCFFASEQPGQRQAQTWFLDFDVERAAFDAKIHKAKLKTQQGVCEMQPETFHHDAVASGFTRPLRDYGLYQIDSFKEFDGRTYCVLNNFASGQNALAVLNGTFDTFEVLGHFNEPQTMKLTEAAMNRLPDGSWLAICRQEGGNHNYTFARSQDGRSWSANEHRDLVPNGTSSKPTFNRFKGVYYLGWQEATKIHGVNRSVFNIEVSTDGMNWERKYRFETEKSFQYPVFREHESSIYLTVTQGDTSDSRKERIMFGRLE